MYSQLMNSADGLARFMPRAIDALTALKIACGLPNEQPSHSFPHSFSGEKRLRQDVIRSPKEILMIPPRCGTAENSENVHSSK